ncbi:MAG: peptide chain release factor N(5)-glutamine methyltransferase [Candidatus Acidiferrales bacterium]
MAETSTKNGVAVRDIRAALKEAIVRLRAAKVPSHTLAAELLLMHALGRDRTWIYTHPETRLQPAEVEIYLSLVTRRAAGEPTQYLTGKQEFWGLEFEVTPAVLIPRPETEHVIEVALDRLGARGIKIRLDTGGPSEPLRVADIGTGSGCLAVALARELPHAEIFAVDISAGALEVARRNAARHGLAGRIHFVQCDLLETFLASSVAGRAQADSNLLEMFDLIVSNPPYVGYNEATTLPREVLEYEPHAALFGGATGVEIYERLIGQADFLLRARGILVLELGYNSADHVLGILHAQPCWANINVMNDLAGIPRVIFAEHIGAGSAGSHGIDRNAD